MPHFIIEHAASINSHQLLTSVREAAVNSQLFAGPDIQVRAIEYSDFQPALFVHIQARIWQGRSPDQKRVLSDLVGESVKAIVGSDVTVSVDIIDMDKACYFKR